MYHRSRPDPTDHLTKPIDDRNTKHGRRHRRKCCLTEFMVLRVRLR